MNICILSHRYPYKDNMVHVFVKKLVDEWAKMGHSCVVISPLSIVHAKLGKEMVAPEYDEYMVDDQHCVKVYRPRYLTIPKVNFRGVSLNGYCEQRCINKTIEECGIKFDAIYCHFYAMAIAGWRYAFEYNIPLFVATGESSFTKFNKPCRSFSFEKLRNTLTGVVAVSTKNKNEAVKLGYANEADVKVFPNGANLGLFSKKDKKECRDLLHLPQEAFILICVGQFVERKGQKRILKALDQLNNPHIKTIFLGKGEDVLEHPSILYKGVIRNTDLPLYLNAADAFVLPTQHEGCCNAIIEALACGLPIISSDRSFNHDVLNSDNSILVDPDNVDEIADAINRLYSKPELCNKLAESSYTMGQSLSITQRAVNILEFMKQKISEKQ